MKGAEIFVVGTKLGTKSGGSFYNGATSRRSQEVGEVDYQVAGVLEMERRADVLK
jgi:hypothetical protein